MGNAQGIDVSHYQGTINWAAVKAAGISFAFIKASEGGTYQDPQFATNWQGAKDAGVLRGAYHFFRPGQNAITQAEHFVSVAQDGDLPPALDVEASDGLSISEVYSQVAICLAELAKWFNKRLVYTSKGFWGSGARPDAELWVASWTSAQTPTMPGDWATWRFWQYSSKGNIGGLNPVDLDQYNGTLDELRAWVAGVTPVPGGCANVLRRLFGG